MSSVLEEGSDDTNKSISQETKISDYNTKNLFQEDIRLSEYLTFKYL